MLKGLVFFIVVVFLSLKSEGSNIYRTIDSLNTIASENNNKNSDFALEKAKTALRYAISALYKKGAGDALHNIGMNHYFKGNRSEALNLFIKSLAAKRLAQDSAGIAKTYNMLAIFYDDIGLTDKALNYHFQAYKIYNSIADNYGIASQFNNIGLIFKKEGEFEKSKKFYEASYKLALKSMNGISISIYLNNIGDAYFLMKQYDSAYKYFIQAKQIREQINDLQGLVTTYADIGNLLGKIGKNKQAEEYLLQSFSIAEKIQVKHEIVYAANGLTELYQQMNRCHESFKYFKIQKLYEDSINESGLSAALTKLEEKSKYEKELKTQEIEQLKKDMQNQKQLEKQKHLRNVFVFGSALLLVLALMLYRIYKIKRKDNELLELQKDRINEKNEELVQQQTEIIAQRDEIEKQNINILQKSKLITDSIKNALRIQNAILPARSRFNLLSKDFFIFYKPKDIVSGDYYWLEKFQDKIYFAAVDCTGHGVSGSLMSMLSYSLLNQALYDQRIQSPSKILEWLNTKLFHTLNKEEKLDYLRDSMDLVICCFDPKTRELNFSGAKNTLLHIGKDKFHKYRGDIHSIGQPFDNDFSEFTERKLQILPNDNIYLFSDGFFDQFGGKNNKKYTKKRLIEFLKDISHLSAKKQGELVKKEFYSWLGEQLQIDDVLVIGVKFTTVG